MSLFVDTRNVFGTSPYWNSSEWTNFYYKPTSRMVDSASGEDRQIKVWFADAGFIGETVTVGITNQIGDDKVNLWRYTSGGATYSNTDVYYIGAQDSAGEGEATTARPVYTDRACKHWFLPGIGLQWLAGTDAQSSYTEHTTYTIVPTVNDIGSKVFDGGKHCWVKFPYDTVAAGSSNAEKYVYTKPIPLEKSGDLIWIWNSFGHQVRRQADAVGVNVAFTLEVQYSYGDNRTDGVGLDWFTSGAKCIDDVDIEDDGRNGTTTGANQRWMMRGIITPLDGVKYIRFKMYHDDGAFTETRMLYPQFIRLSVYPTNIH